jgi:hypothetical protein
MELVKAWLGWLALMALAGLALIGLKALVLWMMMIPALKVVVGLVSFVLLSGFWMLVIVMVMLTSFVAVKWLQDASRGQSRMFWLAIWLLAMLFTYVSVAHR